MRRLRLPRPRWAAAGAWLQRINPRVRWTEVAIVAILLLGLVPIGLSVSGVVPQEPVSGVVPQGTNAPSPTASPSASAEATAGTTATLPPTPLPTPEGTAAPPPPDPVDQAASATVSPPPPPAQATPTRTPQPGLWRIQGFVVDENGKPLTNVCVRVGRPPCQRYSLHTDERGHYFLDVAQPLNGVTTTFDFYFEMPGYQTVWWQFTPGGPIEFNVVLRKS